MDDDSHRWQRCREFAFNVVLAAFFAALAYRFILDFQQTNRLSSLFYVLFSLVVVLLSFSRRMPKAVSWNPFDWGLASLATVLPLLLVPAASRNSWFWFAVQCVGEGISTIALLTLNRSLGVVPANRGLKTSGMYRLVRHPMYCGYCISDLAMLVQNFCVWNLCLAGAHLIVQTLRIIREERFLLQDPAYADYASRVRWRLFPAIW
ncbi:MAG TPA: methyltransferase [Lacipirellulaceae bacterium]|jgi:protein-S-isoprenylcysteine O-methyltransferase Ste14|nr:methyltransferase [Lacipirellulaceae bacterium]